ncbi:MAG TPA: Glu/Leu/Phe/Val dehydrogenase dimerization domain-containing protein [Solirubrobacteraceae bacterium]
MLARRTGSRLAAGMNLHLCRDPSVGLRAVIAIDDTTLGPALGGVRWKAYASEDDAVAECRRLAAGMTLKNAAAELPYGGGKSVILNEGTPVNRRAVLQAFGRCVAALDGAYIPGVDMGTTIEDLAVVGTVASDVACSTEDPSPWTALGTAAAIRSAVRHADGAETLAGVRVAIQGAGHVGASLADLLARDGAEVIVADVDSARSQQVAASVGGHAVAATAILTTPCDVLAPCAVARVISASTLDSLRCRIVAGAANDMLADRPLADALAARGITYVPDFIANAGGVVHIHALRAGWDEDRLRTEVLKIGGRVTDTLTAAGAAGTTPLAAAEALARRRIARGRDGRAGRRDARRPSRTDTGASSRSRTPASSPARAPR